ncbi:hypothetical protein QMK38_16330 [Lysinibacillus fusiformis]|nr:hypothetical protein [Lysinibacillus fusiformis]
MFTNDTEYKNHIMSNFYDKDNTNEINVVNELSFVEKKVKNYVLQNINDISSEELILYKEILEIFKKMKDVF